MEHAGQQIHHFYDGDFTFHVAEYDHDPRLNHIFRVRIDNASPEERARQNVRNHNGSPPGWSRIREATPGEADVWSRRFRDLYPPRKEAHSHVLRRLALERVLHGDDLLPSEQAACRELSRPVTVVRDFVPRRVPLVESQDDVFRLTDDGRWLTSLMK